MKHDWLTTGLLIALFIVAQIVGLHIVSQYIDVEQSALTGETVTNEDLYLVAPPEVENESFAWIPIVVAILIGTVLILIIAKFNQVALWKLWFFISIVVALGLAVHPYAVMLFKALGFMSYALVLTGLVSIGLAYLKTYKPNTWVHNITEVFIYGGLAALFVPILNLWSAVIVLVLISIYDAYAVWKSQHMVKLAEFQTESNVFAGLYLPKKVKKGKETKKSFAILGGGDIAFPLLFAGAILKYTNDLWIVSLIIAGSVIALISLFVLSKPGKYYPAMPILSIGCLAGYLIGILL